MLKTKMSKSERIRAQIEALKKAALEAEKRERDAAKREVTKAAVKAGLHTLGLTADELETEFSRIAEKHKRACINDERRDDGTQESEVWELDDEQQKQEASERPS